MVQSIELLLDEDAETAIRGSWTTLASAGLPSLASHAGDSNRPHVTVAVTEERGFETAVAALRAVFQGWALASEGVGEVVGSPVLFGGRKQRYVLARQIVPSRPLLTLHSAVHRALEQYAPDAAVATQTAPDSWTPHVTLARRIAGDRLGDALGVLEAEPIECRFVGARLWDSVEKTVTPLAAIARGARQQDSAPSAGQDRRSDPAGAAESC